MARSPGDGHIPFLMHQPSLSSMNMDAARAAVTESLRAKPTTESYPGADSGAPPPFNASGLRSIHSGSISDLRKKIESTPKPDFLKGSQPPSPTRSQPTTPTRKLPERFEPAKEVGTPTEIPKEPEPVKELEKPANPKTALEPDLEPAKKPMEETKVAELISKASSVPAEDQSKQGNIQPVAAGEYSSPAPAAQNQKQDIPAKASLGNNLNSLSAPPPESSSDLPRSPKPKDGGGERVPRKARMVRRLKEHKLALLTSDAMAQMGCNGFVTKQKEVISKACSLL